MNFSKRLLAMNGAHLINNPVVGTPWKKHFERVTLPPENYRSLLAEKRRLSRIRTKSKREENINTLQMRYPFLAKCHARAILTLSQNKLEKAIVFIEISRKCQEIIDKSDQLANIQMNLIYKQELYVKSRQECHENYNSSSTSDTNSRDDSTTSSKKVGIKIKKTDKGYEVTQLGDS